MIRVMEYDIEAKIKGKIEVKRPEDLKVAVWEYLNVQLDCRAPASDCYETRCICVRDHRTGKAIDIRTGKAMDIKDKQQD